MNLNTLFLGVIATAAVIVAGVWLNDRFNPKTAEELWLQQIEDAADLLLFRYEEQVRRCASIVDTTQRIMENCD